MASVSVYFGGQAQFDFTLDRPAIIVGRDASCDVRINNPSVSRKHVQFLNRSGAILIKDLNSSNGTYVRGQRIVNESLLSDGDEVTVGLYTLRYNHNGGVAAVPAGVPAMQPQAPPAQAFQPPPLPTVPLQIPQQPAAPQQWAPQGAPAPAQFAPPFGGGPPAAMPYPQGMPGQPPAPYPQQFAPADPNRQVPAFAPGLQQGRGFEQQAYAPRYSGPLTLQEQDVQAIGSLGTWALFGGIAMGIYGSWAIIRALIWMANLSRGFVAVSLIAGAIGLACGLLSVLAASSLKQLPYASGERSDILRHAMSRLSFLFICQAVYFMLLLVFEVASILTAGLR